MAPMAVFGPVPGESALVPVSGTKMTLDPGLQTWGTLSVTQAGMPVSRPENW